MTISLAPEQVWQALEHELFAVLGMVTAHDEARTAGVVYLVIDHKLYVGTETSTWKARHMAHNPHVSVTVPIAKRIPFLPWIKIPAATITFSGTARIVPAAEASPQLVQSLFRGLKLDAQEMASLCLIEITPRGDFVTYGVGVPLMQMRQPVLSRGRAPVATHE